MYNITAVKGNLKLDLSSFFKDITDAKQVAKDVAIKEANLKRLFNSLVYDYKVSLEDAFRQIGASSIKIELHEHWGNKLESILKFGHGRASAKITFNQSNEGDFVGEVSYCGIGTFEYRKTNVESVAQIIEFLERPIKLLLIDNFTTDYNTQHELEKGLIDEIFRK
jgi:hypothetical protein